MAGAGGWEVNKGTREAGDSDGQRHTMTGTPLVDFRCSTFRVMPRHSSKPSGLPCWHRHTGRCVRLYIRDA